jgi:signal peptidase II
MSDKLTLEQVQHAYGQLPTPKEFFYDWGGANAALFRGINSLHSPSYDAFMRFVTQLGDHHFFVPYMLVLGVYAAVTILFKKLLGKGGVKQQFYMWLGVFLVMVASFAAYGILSSWLKDYFQYARPYVLIEGTVQLENREAADAYHSLPSGHVGFISIMIFSLWPLLSHHMKMLGLFLIALVAWSRIALGVHFPADTLWACVLGFSIAFFTRAVVYTFVRKIFRINCGGI